MTGQPTAYPMNKRKFSIINLPVAALSPQLANRFDDEKKTESAWVRVR